MKIISENIINKTKFLIFKTINYLNKNNQLCKWDMVSRVGGKKLL